MNTVNNNKKFIIISAIAALVVIGYGVFVYLFVFPKGKNQNSNKTVAAKSRIEPTKVRLDLQGGTISSDKFLYLTLKLTGLENRENIEELTKSKNILVEVNEKQSEIQNTESLGNDSLTILAKTEINEEIFNDFNSGKIQNLEIRTDLQYEEGKTATKMLSSSFSKKGTTTSMGQELSFGNTKETDVANSTIKKPDFDKPKVASKPKPTIAKPVNQNVNKPIKPTRTPRKNRQVDDDIFGEEEEICYDCNANK